MAASLFNIVANLKTVLEMNPREFLSQVKSTFDDATNIISSFAKVGGTALSATFKNADIGKFLSSLNSLPGLENMFSAPIDTAMQKVGQLRQFVSKEFTSMWDSPIDYAKGRIEAFGASAESIFKKTFDETSFKKFAEGVYDTFNKLPEVFSQIRQGDFSAAFTSIQQEVDKLLSSFNDPSAQQNNLFSRLGVGLADFKKSMTNFGRATLQEMGVLDTVDAQIKHVTENWQKLYDPDLSPLENASKALEGAFGTFGDTFMEQLNKLAEGDDAAGEVAKYLRGIINAGKDIYTALSPIPKIMDSVSGAFSGIADAGANAIKEIAKAPDSFGRLRAAASGVGGVLRAGVGGGLDIAATALKGVYTLLGTTTGMVVGATAAFAALGVAMVASMTAGAAQAAQLDEAVRKLDGTVQSLGSNGGSLDSLRDNLQKWSATSSAAIQEVASVYQDLLLTFGDSTAADAIVDLASKIASTDANKSIAEMSGLLAKLQGGASLSAQEMRRLGLTFADVSAAGFDNAKVVELLSDRYSNAAENLDNVNQVSRSFAAFAAEGEKIVGPLVAAFRKVGIAVGSFVIDAGTTVLKINNLVTQPLFRIMSVAADTIGEVWDAASTRVGEFVSYLDGLGINAALLSSFSGIDDAVMMLGKLKDAVAWMIPDSVKDFWDVFLSAGDKGAKELEQQVLEQNKLAAMSTENRRAIRRKELEDAERYNSGSLTAQGNYVRSFNSLVFKSQEQLDADIAFMRNYYAKRVSLIDGQLGVLASREAETGKVLLRERVAGEQARYDMLKEQYSSELRLAIEQRHLRVKEAKTTEEALAAAAYNPETEDANLLARRQELEKAHSALVINSRKALYDAVAAIDEAATTQFAAASAFRPASADAIGRYYKERKAALDEQIEAAQLTAREQARLSAQYVQLQAEETRALRDEVSARVQLTASVVTARIAAEEAVSGKVIDLSAAQYKAQRDANLAILESAKNLPEEYLQLANQMYGGAIAEVNRSRDAHIAAINSMSASSRAFFEFEQTYRGNSARAQLEFTDKLIAAQRRATEASQGNARAEREALLSQVALSRERLNLTAAAIDELMGMQTTLSRQAGELQAVFARTSIERTAANVAVLRQDYDLAEKRLAISKSSGEARLREEQSLNEKRLRLISATVDQANELVDRALSGEYGALTQAKSKQAVQVLTAELNRVREKASEGVYATGEEALQDFGRIMDVEVMQRMRSQLTRGDSERISAELRDVFLSLNGVNTDVVDAAKKSLDGQRESLESADAKVMQLANEQTALIKSTSKLSDSVAVLDDAMLQAAITSRQFAELDLGQAEVRVATAEQRRFETPVIRQQDSAALARLSVEIGELKNTIKALKAPQQQPAAAPAPAVPKPAQPAPAAPAAPIPPKEPEKPATPAPAAPIPPKEPEKPAAPVIAKNEPETAEQRDARFAQQEIDRMAAAVRSKYGKDTATADKEIAARTADIRAKYKIPDAPPPKKEEPPAPTGALAVLAKALEKVADAIQKAAGNTVVTPEFIEKIMIGMAVELQKEV